MKKDSLILGDCLQVMNDIPDRSVDAVICDLPYGVLKKQNPGAKWDCVLPLNQLWEQYLRVAKENAAIILFAQGMFTAKLMMSQPKIWRYNLVWNKVTKTGFLNSKKQPLRQHEDICIFYRDQPTYHPQMVKGKKHRRDRGMTKCNTYGKFKPIDTPPSEWYYPTDILTFSKASEVNDSFHPTVKPVALLRYLIRQYTNEGDTVLDNTMGSGSTCVAAIKEQRHYIGIEKEKKYYDIAESRVLEAKNEVELFDD